MPTRPVILAVILVLIAALTATLSAPASARQYALGDLSVVRPWARALPPVAPNGAAYLRIENAGNAADRIVSASSPIAEHVELHTHEMDGAVMRMRQVHSVEVPARGAVSFEPGRLHVMLIGLKAPLVAGRTFPLTIEFRDAGALEVMVEIADGAPADHAGHEGRASGRTQ